MVGVVGDRDMPQHNHGKGAVGEAGEVEWMIAGDSMMNQMN